MTGKKLKRNSELDENGVNNILTYKPITLLHYPFTYYLEKNVS